MTVFNIKVRSLTLSNFTAKDVATLYRQHTDETGQAFTPEAMELAFALTLGQPWLVNALAKVAVEELVTDVSRTIAAEHIEQAKGVLIERQETHLDSLAERLREPRVRAVVEPILAGSMSPGDLPPDDIRYVQDLGLVRIGPMGSLDVANPIYREVIPYVLDGYLDGLTLDSGWLVIFDRRKDQPPISQRTKTETAVTPSGRDVTVIRA